MTYTREKDDYRSDVTAPVALRREPLDGIEKVHAKYGHLRERKRQTKAEERARADLSRLFLHVGAR